MTGTYLEIPHLPKGQVGLLAIGEGYRPRLEAPLSRLGVECLWLPADARLDHRLASHADLLLAHLGGDLAVAAGEGIVNLLTNRGFRAFCAENERNAVYPGDISLNLCIVGSYLFHRLRYTDRRVLALAGGYRAVDVRQGYARCAVCIVDERAIITADAGIAESAALCGIETLRIRAGFIELPGFAHGFLGGASCKLAPDKLAFTGTLQAHPDRDRILSFLEARGVEPLYLTDGPAFDIGSAVPLLTA